MGRSGRDGEVWTVLLTVSIISQQQLISHSGKLNTDLLFSTDKSDKEDSEKKGAIETAKPLEDMSKIIMGVKQFVVILIGVIGALIGAVAGAENGVSGVCFGIVFGIIVGVLLASLIMYIYTRIYSRAYSKQPAPSAS